MLCAVPGIPSHQSPQFRLLFRQASPCPNPFISAMAGGGRRRRAAAEARLQTGGSGSGHEMAMMNSGMLGGGMSFAQGQGTLEDALHQQNTRDAKLGIGKAADDANLSPFDPRAWFTEMTRFLLFLIFFNVSIFSGKQGQDIFDCECAVPRFAVL